MRLKPSLFELVRLGREHRVTTFDVCEFRLLLLDLVVVVVDRPS
jgi:hypothetical protein